MTGKTRNNNEIQIQLQNTTFSQSYKQVYATALTSTKKNTATRDVIRILS